ncbi:MAG TPA: ATP synthase subunit C [Phycisphaerae bacterium]|mgnify:CR=1 FL=1|nr:H+transporting two-sector ATPase C subunit [Phycisphaerae bacterium]HOI55665.1 ATP synthase subunit C [Phycisphaerae bacterium]
MKHLAMALVLMTLVAAPALAQEQAAADGTATGKGLLQEHHGMVASFVACAIAFITGVSVLGAAYAVAHVGSAAIGAASEKPEMMGRGLIFVALGEGLAVLGLAVAFLMMFMILRPLI